MSRVVHQALAAAAGFWLAAGAAMAAPPLEAVVTQVIDGQTVLLAPAGAAPVTLRLAGIEAPLLCQPWGIEARDALKDWVLNRAVVVKPAGRDGKGGVLGSVLLAGDDINRRLVEEGHAWSARVKWDHGPYVKQERMARALGRGLHAAGGALMPQDFRRSHGPC